MSDFVSSVFHCTASETRESLYWESSAGWAGSHLLADSLPLSSLSASAFPVASSDPVASFVATGLHRHPVNF